MQKKIMKGDGSKTHERIICALYDFSNITMKAPQLTSGGTGDL